MPDQIVRAVDKEELAIFLGAGVSQILGCAGWDSLAKNLVKLCYSLKNGEEKTLINFREKQVYEKDSSFKKVISICKIILEKNGLLPRYYEELEKALQFNKQIKTPNIYDEIYKLRASVYLTTNADTHFSDRFETGRVVYDSVEFSSASINPLNLYHLHGSIKDRKSLVFTTSEYLKRYNDDDYVNFLKRVFLKYNVLFIGYGLAEFEILDHLLAKVGSKPENKEIRHFVLKPMLKSDEILLPHEQSYYESLGVGLIPYFIDEVGYEKLNDVIRDWRVQINNISRYTASSFSNLDAITQKYTKKGSTLAFQLIKHDRPQREYFFDLLSKAENPLPWLTPLKNRGYFDPKNNPDPIEDPDKPGYFSIPQWEILTYLEHVASVNEAKPKLTVSKKLLLIIDSVIKYSRKVKKVDNYRTDWFLFKILFKLPLEYITKSHIEYFKKSLESKFSVDLISSDLGSLAFPKAIASKNEKLLFWLLGFLLEYRLTKTSFSKEHKPLVKDYWFQQALEKNRNELCAILKVQALDLGISKIKEITTKDRNQFNSVWIPSIDGATEHFADRYDVQIVFLIREAFKYCSKTELDERLADLLSNKHPIFRRLAYYAISIRYPELNEHFWRTRKNPLVDSECKLEVYQVFERNKEIIEDKHAKRILKWVEELNLRHAEDLPEDKIKLFTAYMRKEWLSSLLPSANKEVEAAFQKYDKVNPAAVDHPAKSRVMRGGWVEHKSPYEVKSLLELPTKDLIDTINNFKAVENDFEGPTLEGLGRTFKAAVMEKPEKFFENLEEYLNAKPVFIYNLLRGFEEIWNAKRDVDWNAILNFNRKLLSDKSFWKETKIESHYNYSEWTIGVICDLITAGTRDDNWAFDTQLIPEALEQLKTIRKNIDSDIKEPKGVVNQTLNTALGKLYRALINLSLRHARQLPATVKNRWLGDVQKVFSDDLLKESRTIEFSVSLGEYIRNIMYLDQAWLIEEFDRIFPLNQPTHWKYTMEGYLFYANQVVKDLYIKLRDGGHYLKGLSTEFSSDELSERIVQHVCVGLVAGYEKIDDPDSLISTVIRDGTSKNLLSIVHFFSSHSKRVPKDVKKYLIPIWQRINQVVHAKGKTNPEYYTVLASAIQFISLVDSLNEEVVNLSVSAIKQSGHDFNYMFVPEYLLKHVENSPRHTAEIYVEMVRANRLPNHEKEDVKKIIDRLYQLGQKPVANEICNAYFTNQMHFLRPIFEKYNN